MSAIITFEDPSYLEAVYEALWQKILTATFANGFPGFKQKLRVVVPPDEVPVASQPAIFMATAQKGSQGEIARIMGPQKWEFHALLLIYVRADSVVGAKPTPATLANFVIWGISNALVATPEYEKQTLGGLVYNAFIDGPIIPEIENEQMWIQIPIKILPGPMGG